MHGHRIQHCFRLRPCWSLLPLAYFIIRSLRKGRQEGDGDPATNAVGGFVMLVFTAAILFASALPFALALPATLDMARGHFSVARGCVTSFTRTVDHANHDIADTYFSLGSKPFHFNISYWLPGFRNEDDLIHEGDGLQITTVGAQVLRVERLATACSSRV